MLRRLETDERLVEPAESDDLTAPSAGWFSMRIGGAGGVAEPWHRTFEAINTRLLSPKMLSALRSRTHSRLCDALVCFLDSYLSILVTYT